MSPCFLGVWSSATFTGFFFLLRASFFFTFLDGFILSPLVQWGGICTSHTGNVPAASVADIVNALDSVDACFAVKNRTKSKTRSGIDGIQQHFNNKGGGGGRQWRDGFSLSMNHLYRSPTLKLDRIRVRKTVTLNFCGIPHDDNPPNGRKALRMGVRR
jgi:hypothetical protein